MFREGLDMGISLRPAEDWDIYFNIEGLHSPLYIEPKCSKRKPALFGNR